MPSGLPDGPVWPLELRRNVGRNGSMRDGDRLPRDRTAWIVCQGELRMLRDGAVACPRGGFRSAEFCDSCHWLEDIDLESARTSCEIEEVAVPRDLAPE